MTHHCNGPNEMYAKSEFNLEGASSNRIQWQIQIPTTLLNGNDTYIYIYNKHTSTLAHVLWI